MARKPATATPGSVLVIGLGRFGGAVADSLVRLGHEVLAIDEDAAIVQSWANRLTHVVQADTTNVAPQLVRGPYLQSGSSTSVVVHWRTSIPTESIVWYGRGSRA